MLDNFKRICLKSVTNPYNYSNRGKDSLIAPLICKKTIKIEKMVYIYSIILVMKKSHVLVHTIRIYCMSRK